jgi:hypothetical protein
MADVKTPFKHTFFRLNQTIYEWGIGWVISTEAADAWEVEVKKLLVQLGFKPIYSKSGRVWEGFNKEGESLYMHPMDFTGYIHEDNVKRYEEIIRAFTSKYWNLKEVLKRLICILCNRKAIVWRG